MNDAVAQLQHCNTDVKLQATMKIISSVNQQLQNCLASELSNETKELTLLFETLVAEDLVCSTACCETVYELTIQQRLNICYVMNKLVSLASVAGNLTSLVHCLTQLLQATSRLESGGTSASNNKLHHPFITLLVNRSECWLLLYQQIETLVEECILISSRCHSVIKLFDPFFKFIFLNRTGSSVDANVVALRHAVVSLFIRSNQVEFLKYLLLLVPALSTEATNVTSETVVMLVNVGHKLLYIVSSTDHKATDVCSVVNVFVTEALSLAVFLLHRDKCVTQLLLIVCKLLDVHAPCPSEVNVAMIHCVLLLFHCPSDHVLLCLQLVRKLLEHLACSRHVVSMLLLPLLQLHSRQSSKQFVGTSCKAALQDCIKKVVEFVTSHSSNDSDIRENAVLENKEQLVAMFPAPISYVCGVYHQLAVELDRAVCCDNRTFLNVWLEQLTNRMMLVPTQSSPPCDKPSAMADYLQLSLLSGILIYSQSLSAVGLCMTVLKLCCQCNPSLSLLMVPLVMFKLSLTQQSQIIHCVLLATPELCTDKLAVSQMLSMYKSLALSPSLTSISLRLTAKLWIRHDFIFPYLMQMLSSSTRKSNVDRMELLLTQASCLLDICKYRPQQHGTDVISMLSTILNCSANGQHTGAACMAFNCLKFLCLDEVVDIRTVWIGIAAKFAEDKRSSVLISLCQLLSTVPRLSVSTKDYQVFSVEIVDLLWKMTRHINPEVASASYKALSEFPSELFLCRHLPPSLADDILSIIDGNADQEDRDSDVTIPGIGYTRLVQYVPRQALPGFKCLIQSLVNKEVAGLPRGMNHRTNRIELVEDSRLSTHLSKVPLNYHSLPSTSVLRALFDLLSLAGKQGDASDVTGTAVSCEVVELVLETVVFAEPLELPPMQWSSLLDPLIQKFGDNVHIHDMCLRLTLQQSYHQATAVVFVMKYLESLSNVHVSLKSTLYRNLRTLVKTIPEAVLNEFLLNVFLEPFQQLSQSGLPDDDAKASECLSKLNNFELCQHAIEGLTDIIRDSQLSASQRDMLVRLFLRVCDLLPVKNTALWTMVIESSSNIPDSILMNFVETMSARKTFAAICLIVCGQLVASGKQPMNLLNSTIEMFVHHSENSQTLCVRHLSMILTQLSFKVSTADQMEWTLQLMGHIKNLADGRVDVASATTKHATMRFFMLIYAVAIISLSNAVSLLPTGVPAKSIDIEALVPFSEEVLQSLIFLALPQALNCLLTRPTQWQLLVVKTIDFLLTVHDTIDVHIDKDAKQLQTIIGRCLYSLKETQEFGNKSGVWNRAASTVYSSITPNC